MSEKWLNKSQSKFIHNVFCQEIHVCSVTRYNDIVMGCTPMWWCLGDFCPWKLGRFPQKRQVSTNATKHERVQALADISRSALCCHSNETHAPIANPPDSAQSPTIPQVTSRSCSRVSQWRWTDGRHTHIPAWPLYICNKHHQWLISESQTEKRNSGRTTIIINMNYNLGSGRQH